MDDDDDPTTCALPGAMGALLAKFDSIIASANSLPSDLKNKVESVMHRTKMIHKLFVDLSELEDPPLMAKLWMREVQELYHDMEDKFAFDAMDDVGNNTIEMARKMVDFFEARVQDAWERQKIYGFRGSLAHQPRRFVSCGPRLGIPTRHEDLIEDHGPMEDIVGHIAVERDEQLRVACILGVAGVGKTTLARRIYQNVRGRFECRAFVRVTSYPDTRRLLTSMFIQIQRQQPHENWDANDLIRNIASHLENKRAFGCEDDCPTDQLREVSYEIIRQCGVEKVLYLVYNNLRPHLKPLLLYLNMYPADYTINKDDLVKQWVAEGFVCLVEGQDREEVAEGYFDELISRGMLQPEGTNCHGQVSSCTVHHAIRDLISWKSMEENFITIVDYFQTSFGFPDKVRRLSVQFGGARGASMPVGIRMSQVRSLAFFGFIKCLPSIVKYKLLRVLVLQIWADQDKTTFDLTTISELYLLKFLKIRCNVTVWLPEKMRNLKFLETLDVHARVKDVPSDIVGLKRLLHLHLPCGTALPDGIGEMISLRTLGYFDITSNLENDVLNLGMLTNLQELHLTCPTAPSGRKLYNIDYVGSLLTKLSNVKSLTLVPSGSGRESTLVVASSDHPFNIDRHWPGRIPSSQVLHIQGLSSCANAGLDNLTSLKEISAKVWRSGAGYLDTRAAEKAEFDFMATIKKIVNTPIINVRCVEAIAPTTVFAESPSTVFAESPSPSQCTTGDKIPREDSGTGDRVSSAVHIIDIVLGKIRLTKQKGLSIHIKGALRFIEDELEMIMTTANKYDELQLQELAYDIEDVIDGLLIPEPSGSIRLTSAVHHSQYPVRIDYIKERIVRLEKQPHKGADTAGPESRSSGYGRSPGYSTAEAYLVGIEKRKEELLDLLVPLSTNQPQLRVVSIVGCIGVGKTALARAIYNDSWASSHFDCIAWVVASECKYVGELLIKIAEILQPEVGVTKHADLHCILAHKRYLVIIDDVQKAKVCKDIVAAFPRNCMCSRIIVTTSVYSVATACSFGRDVYTMQWLNHEESESLFWRMLYGKESNPYWYGGIVASQRIFSKCDGLPLALISVAKHLSLVNGLDTDHLEDVGQNLGIYLADKTLAFEELNRALEHCYDSLPDDRHKECLLYLSIFPKGYLIKRKITLRRWIAEGLVGAQYASKIFDELIDRNIVMPVFTGKCSKDVERCRMHSIMLEFIIQKSSSKNIVTLIQQHGPLCTPTSTVGSVRRLSIQSSTEKSFHEVEDKSTALRSLSIFNSNPFNLQKCMMLRLLDLEGCTSLGQGFAEGLCSLLLLRYLSLRKTDINMLPTQIYKLQCLETLDIRETQVKRLTMEVIMLPKLAYLFGKFQLPDIPKVTKELSDFFKRKSVLHTLSGIVADRRHSPEYVMLLARKLKKVEVWCNDSPGSRVPNNSSSSSQRKRTFLGKIKVNNPRWKNCQEASLRDNNFDFIRLLNMRSTPLESVSIVSNEFCRDFLSSLEGPCTISSIKLQGNLGSLPDSNKLSELRIKKLQLFSAGLTIQELSVLQCMRDLEYLKLVEHNDRFCHGNFIVEKMGFESLKIMCIEAAMLPKMQFKEGAMASLTSLQLFCPNSKKQPTEIIEGISHLGSLTEVIHNSSMQIAWETIAKENPNRPSVSKWQPE
ncbi:unnamed protein product [Urochloa decumbens]|uniref:Uncharacterized protein n=1 Tax=Urochloa decumbens TaxID=240449 RepID=A0ABC9EXV7_9POAL